MSIEQITIARAQMRAWLASPGADAEQAKRYSDPLLPQRLAQLHDGTLERLVEANSRPGMGATGPQAATLVLAWTEQQRRKGMAA